MKELIAAQDFLLQLKPPAILFSGGVNLVHVQLQETFFYLFMKELRVPTARRM